MMLRSFLIAVCVALGIASGCQAEGTDQAGTDGVTHFLRTCAGSEECGGEFSCVCGVCSKTCESNNDCSDLGLDEPARCQMGAAVCTSAPAPAEQGICTLACESDAECRSDELDMRCSEQRCVQRTLAEFPGSSSPACAEGAACQGLTCPTGQYIQRIDPECCRCDELPECDSGEAVLVGTAVIAERLSLSLFGEAADEQLLIKADEAGLTQSRQVGCFAREMLADPRAAVGVASFFERWWLRPAPEMIFENQENPGEYPLELEQALRNEVTAYGVHVTLESDGLLEPLFTAPFAFVNEWSAPTYGLEGISGDELRRVDLPQPERAGLLTRGFFLAAYGMDGGISIVRRGATVARDVLCAGVPPPPGDVNTSLPEQPSATTTDRQRLSPHVASASCAGCHNVIDPLGFGLEHFDSRGVYQTEQAGLPIDASGELRGITVNGEMAASFAGPQSMMQLLADADQTKACVAEKWLDYLLNHDPEADPVPTADLAVVTESLVPRSTLAEGFSLRELIAGAAETELFLAP